MKIQTIKNIVWVLIIILSIVTAFMAGIIKGEGQTREEANEIIKNQIALSKEIKVQEEKRAKCVEVLKELKIPNTCEEVRKIINEFGRDKIFVAVILHESNFDRNAVNVNEDGSVDRGIFQLNSNYWGEVNGDIDHSISKAKKCLEDNGIRCFWAYRNGSYLKHLDNADKLLEATN